VQTRGIRTSVSAGRLRGKDHALSGVGGCREDAANSWPQAGTVLGTRVLLHPHEDEQPFTRELENVRIPDTVRSVSVRAWMKRGSAPRAAGGEAHTVRLPPH
jgi:hypothetical protein